MPQPGAHPDAVLVQERRREGDLARHPMASGVIECDAAGFRE